MVVSRHIYIRKSKYSQNVDSVLDTPKGFTDEVNNIKFDYIWDYKNPKLIKTTIIKNKKNGGLNM